MLKENAIMKTTLDVIKKEKATTESCLRVELELNVIAVKSWFLE